MDVHIPASVTRALRLRRVDVITAQEDGCRMLEDPALLDRSSSLDRALVTQDEDLLIEASHRIRHAIPFTGVIYAYQTGITIGRFIDDLELISSAADMYYIYNRVEWLPLKR
jgi:Domain of unknown function (DUF5615)